MRNLKRERLLAWILWACALVVIGSAGGIVLAAVTANVITLDRAHWRCTEYRKGNQCSRFERIEREETAWRQSARQRSAATALFT